MSSDLLKSPQNQKLANLYSQRWPTMRSIMKKFYSELSWPYLAWVHPDYDQADIRLVVIGQETRGWGQTLDKTCSLADVTGPTDDQAVKELMQFYCDWKLGMDEGKRGFWQACHELYRLLNDRVPSGSLGFVALNASKIAQNSRTPNDEIRDALISTDLLRNEIRILEPHVVLFHTGPKYERWLDGWFPDIKRDQDSMLFSRVEATGLPKLSFRSYHPGYLNRISKRRLVYEQIKDEVTKNGTS